MPIPLWKIPSLVQSMNHVNYGVLKPLRTCTKYGNTIDSCNLYRAFTQRDLHSFDKHFITSIHIDRLLKYTTPSISLHHNHIHHGYFTVSQTFITFLMDLTLSQAHTIKHTYSILHLH